MVIKLLYDGIGDFDFTHQKTKGFNVFYFCLPEFNENNRSEWLDIIKEIDDLRKIDGPADDEIYCYITLTKIQDAENFLMWFPYQVDFIYYGKEKDCPLRWARKWKSWLLHDIDAGLEIFIDSKGYQSSFYTF